jgi:hypothetical protein
MKVLQVVEIYVLFPPGTSIGRWCNDHFVYLRELDPRDLGFNYRTPNML